MIDNKCRVKARELILESSKTIKRSCPHKFIPELSHCPCVMSNCDECRNSRIDNYLSKYKSVNGVSIGTVNILKKAKISTKSCPSENSVCTYTEEGKPDCTSCWKKVVRERIDIK